MNDFRVVLVEAVMITAVLAIVPTEILFRVGIISRFTADIAFWVLNMTIIFPIYSWLEKRSLRTRKRRMHVPEPYWRIIKIIVILIGAVLGTILLGLL